MTRQIILDTETTGIRVEEGHRIIEIGCIEMIDRKLTQRHFHHYLNPEREIDSGALAIHGISKDFLKDKPYFRDIAHEFVEFIDGSELIIHNAPFDVAFLNEELMRVNPNFKRIDQYCRILDTLSLARKIHVGQRNNLDALCKRYNIDNTKRELHGALLDASLLGQVYLAMTVGQESFEALNDLPINNHPEFSSDTKPIFRKSLKIHQASESELLAHEEYLSNLHKIGKCLWLDD